MIYFFYEFFFKINLDKNSLKKLIFNVVKYEGYKIGNINIIFCNDNYLLNINLKFLKKNNYTDVIAFEIIKKKNIYGDIYISLERILYNSKKFQENFFHELKRVIIHAILHFIGYKDKYKKEKKIMYNKENLLLNLFS
jgi:probable rRNA maturation factor